MGNPLRKETPSQVLDFRRFAPINLSFLSSEIGVCLFRPGAQQIAQILRVNAEKFCVKLPIDLLAHLWYNIYRKKKGSKNNDNILTRRHY